MKTVSLLGLLVVLSVAALHSAGAEEAMRELDSAVREIELRELEETLRNLEVLKHEIRGPLNGNQDEKLQKRFLGDLLGLGLNVGKAIHDMVQGNGRKLAALAE